MLYREFSGVDLRRMSRRRRRGGFRGTLPSCRRNYCALPQGWQTSPSCDFWSRLGKQDAERRITPSWCGRAASVMSTQLPVPARRTARRQSALPRRSYSGYNMARMRFEIILAPEVVQDLQNLKANVRTVVKEALETHLRHEPTKTSKSRIKRLRGLARPQYRLRVEEVRVFYDVSGSTVEVLAIVAKSEAQSWLAQFGSPV
jgi:mRNA interferase RelE/StbE